MVRIILQSHDGKCRYKCELAVDVPLHNAIHQACDLFELKRDDYVFKLGEFLGERILHDDPAQTLTSMHYAQHAQLWITWHER